MTESATQPSLTISQILVVSAEFRHRDDFWQVDPRQIGPSGSALVEVRTQGFNEGDAVGVSVRVSSDPEDANLRYRYSIEVMALIEKEANIAVFPDERALTVMGGTILYPFVRELLANLTMRGRFGAVWLAPFNLQAAMPVTEAATP